MNFKMSIYTIATIKRKKQIEMDRESISVYRVSALRSNQLYKLIGLDETNRKSFGRRGPPIERLTASGRQTTTISFGM